MYVPFDQVKRLADIVQVAAWLKLDLRNNRCQCPINRGDKRELAVTPQLNLFKCFGCDLGGDQIALASHVLDVDMKKAALEMQRHFHGYEPVERGLPADGLGYLEAEHDAVQALGLAPERARQLGIGWAPRGTMLKRVLFPIRDTTGKLCGYIGYNPQDGTLKLPKSL